MTPNSTYIDWLDREIDRCKKLRWRSTDREEVAWHNRVAAYQMAREKFLSLYPSQEVGNDEARQFTDGLD